MSTDGPGKSKKGTIFGGLGVLGLLALKGKGAFLLFGAKLFTLLKMSWLLKSLLSIFATFGIYGATLGWPYALAVITILMMNTMGQYIWMKGIGLKPSLPVLIPFVGATGTGVPPGLDDMTRAWIAFSGPLIGGVGSATLYWAGLHLDQIWLQAAGSSGFFFNLIQLIPAKPLAGGYVVHAVSKWLLIPGTVFLVYIAYKFQSIILFLAAVISALGLVGQFMLKPRAQEIQATEEASAPSGASAEPRWDDGEQKPPTPLQRATIGLAYLSLVWMLADLYSITTTSLGALIKH